MQGWFGKSAHGSQVQQLRAVSGCLPSQPREGPESARAQMSRVRGLASLLLLRPPWGSQAPPRSVSIGLKGPRPQPPAWAWGPLSYYRINSPGSCHKDRGGEAPEPCGCFPHRGTEQGAVGDSRVYIQLPSTLLSYGRGFEQQKVSGNPCRQGQVKLGLRRPPNPPPGYGAAIAAAPRRRLDGSRRFSLQLCNSGRFL